MSRFLQKNVFLRKHDFSRKLTGGTGLQGVSSNLNLGPTLPCLVAEKAKFPNYNFSITTTKPLNQVRMGDAGEYKKAGWRKELAKLEKENDVEAENGREKKREGK